MVPFSGWQMPLLYDSIGSEHEATRRSAGLFDLGHMGRIRFRGPAALDLAQRVQTADVSALDPGRTRYGLVCAEDGGILDDILISREEDGFLLVVNAGNREIDLTVFGARADGLDVQIHDQTESLAMIALQGPRAAEIVTRLGLEPATKLRYYGFTSCAGAAGPVLVSRTGYTGEDGFEVLLPAAQAEDLFLRALEAGQDLGVVPCGLGARDTLRLEAGMPLYGHEIGRQTNAFEAGLAFAVQFTHPFVGAEALQRIQRDGPARRLVGLMVEGPRVPRPECPVLLEGQVVGAVSSGTRSPTLGRNIATAMVAQEAATGAAFEVDIRGRRVKAQRTDLPFYRRKDS